MERWERRVGNRIEVYHGRLGRKVGAFPPAETLTLGGEPAPPKYRTYNMAANAAAPATPWPSPERWETYEIAWDPEPAEVYELVRVK
jgi:hypothetical protein